MKKQRFGKQGRKGPKDLGMKYRDDRRRPAGRGAGGNKIPPAVSRKIKGSKLLKALVNKKDREEKKLFIVEGDKSFLEAVNSSYEVHSVFVSNSFLELYPQIRELLGDKVYVVDEPELATLGTLANNRSVIGIFHMPRPEPFILGSGITLALCDVNDPGNLGTILRIADWYGIRTIVASRETVDMFNPKVISASKGSFTRVNVIYRDLAGFFREHQNVPVIAADMYGDNAHTMKFPEQGILLLGNESHGIRPELDSYVSDAVTIPRYGGAESLNVAIATAVILDNWLR